jgi:aminoglycoside 6'-N-acetyltransferase
VTSGGEQSAAAHPAVPPSEGGAGDIPEHAALGVAAGAAPGGPPVLCGRIVTLRPANAADAPALLAILDEPEVAAWWRRDEWERLAGSDAVSLVVEVDGGTAGCIQYHEETDPDYFSAAVDVFVSSAVHGRGVGRDAMRTLIAWLVDVRGHHRLTVDPAAANGRAIHVYAALGFRPVGTLRQYERAGDGVWRDALLMELLASDFVREGAPLQESEGS